MTDKIANYTPEQTKELVALYQAGVAVDEIAKQLNKTARSVVAKLSREGVYQAKARVRQGAVVRKSDLIAQIALATNTNEELLESLEKATKEALEVLAQAVKA
jgi:hypothetical protein